MASLFDTSAFIEAERRQKSQSVATIAAPIAACDTLTATPKPPETLAFMPAADLTIAKSQQSQPSTAETLPWQDDIDALHLLPCPTGMTDARWKRLLRITRSVSREWGRTALDAGWHPLELFGCNPEPMARRVDRNGLVASIFGLSTPVEVTEISRTCAVLSVRIGAPMRYRPIGPRGQVYLWHAYRQGGP